VLASVSSFFRKLFNKKGYFKVINNEVLLDEDYDLMTMIINVIYNQINKHTDNCTKNGDIRDIFDTEDLLLLLPLLIIVDKYNINIRFPESRGKYIMDFINQYDNNFNLNELYSCIYYINLLLEEHDKYNYYNAIANLLYSTISRIKNIDDIELDNDSYDFLLNALNLQLLPVNMVSSLVKNSKLNNKEKDDFVKYINKIQIRQQHFL